MRILLTEDDTSMGEATRRALRSQGWAVDWIEQGESLAQTARREQYDLIVLDVGLPGIDGFEALRRLRSLQIKVPVLMLTARDAVEDRVRGLETGADDYLVKPFAMPELLARVRALSRRALAHASNELTLGRLRMDLGAKRAFIGDAPLQLSAREWAVLAYLLAQAGKVVSKEQILSAIVGWDEGPSSNAIEVYVSRLRGKISDAGVTIRSIRGFGYLVEDDSSDG
ncbi:MAG: response regulator transcription factor [Burkholderiaceae bacterium]